MKLFPQPITSPNRIEKYSPTLIRSIRSGNGRSKSRRRTSSSSSSRLSPMFSIRTTKRNNNGRNETTLEPSSPKVNCCGEIRVKRSSSNQTTSKKIVKTNHNWIQKVLFCKCSSIAKTKKKSRPVLGKWLVCLQIGCFQKRVEQIVVEDDDNNMESGKEDTTQDGHDDDKGEEISEPSAKVVSVVSTSPPKNALLLMRSRSESYYRPTSLAHLFWGSPNEEEEEEEDEDEVTEQNVNPRWSKDTKSEEQELGVSEEIKSPRNKIGDELKKTRMVFDQFSHRVLRRSKSDPARISEEVINDSENSLWKRRRLGFEFEEEEEHS